MSQTLSFSLHICIFLCAYLVYMLHLIVHICLYLFVHILAHTLWYIKSIIELMDPSGICALVENRSRRSTKLKHGVVLFYDNEWRNLPSRHNPLYITTNVKAVKVSRATLDPGSSLNIMSLSLRCSRHTTNRITSQPIEVSSFRGHNS